MEPYRGWGCLVVNRKAVSSSLFLKGVHIYMWMAFAPQKENCLEYGLKNDGQDVFCGGCFQSQCLGTWESDVGEPRVLGCVSKPCLKNPEENMKMGS